MEGKYRHIYQDTAIPVFMKETQTKHDVTKIDGEDFCEWRQNLEAWLGVWGKLEGEADVWNEFKHSARDNNGPFRKCHSS